MITMSKFLKGVVSSPRKPTTQSQSTFYLPEDYDNDPPINPRSLDVSYPRTDSREGEDFHESTEDPEDMSESMTDESFGGIANSPGRTYSYEALASMNLFSRFRRDSYNMSIHSSNQDILDGNSSGSPSTQGSNNFPLRPNEVILKTVSKVHRFSMGSKQRHGSTGCLVLTNLRLKFVGYLSQPIENVREPSPSSLLSQQSKSLPPFDLHSFLEESNETLTPFDEDIDLMMTYKLEECKNFLHNKTLMTVLCFDCRRIDFLLDDQETSRHLIEHLSKMIPPASVSSSLTQSMMTMSPRYSNSSSSNLLSSSLGHHSSKKINEIPLFFYEIVSQYPYSDRNDWELAEGHWLTPASSLLRISLCNEGYQVCRSIPKSFVTLASSLLSDITIMQSISPQMSGQRVPIICFSLHVGHRSHRMKASKSDTLRSEWHQKTSNKPSRTVSFLRSKDTKKDSKNSIRSSYPSSNETTTRPTDHHILIRSVPLTEDVSNLLKDKLQPIKIYYFGNVFKGPSAIDAAHVKILEAVFSKSTSNFLSSVGKWMKLIARILKYVFEIVHVLQHEASVVITEEDDRLWNPIVSSLVQIVLDDHRRTVKGFESLVSKEFMFVTGYANRFPESLKYPSHRMFALFLDCVHQLMSFSSNGFAFEFTSLYLVRIFDRVYLPSPIQSVEGGNKITTASFEDLTRVASSTMMEEMTNIRKHRLWSTQHKQQSSFLPLSLEGLPVQSLMLIFNPLYDSNQVKSVNGPRLRTIVLSVPTHPAELQLFEGLWLRWNWSAESRKVNPHGYYRRFPRLQEVAFDQVLRSINLYSSLRRPTPRDNFSKNRSPEIRETSL